MSERSNAIATMAVSSVFFAAMSFCVKWAAPVPALQIVFFRALIAAVLCLAQLRWQGVSPLGTHHRLLMLRGLFGSVALIAYFWSLSTLPLATASVLQSTAPLFTALLAVVVLSERLSKFTLTFFVLAAAGVVIMRGPGDGGPLWGVGIALFGAFSSACAYTTIARIGKREHPLVIVLWFPLITLPLVAPLLPSIWVWPTPKQWLAMLGVGVCVQIAQVAMTRAYQMGPTSVVSLVSYLGLVWAGLGGLLLFDEALTMRLLFGAALVVLAVVGISQVRAPAVPR